MQHRIRATLAIVANLTITIDDNLLKQARLRALEQGTSVNAVLRKYLESYAGADRAEQAVASLLALAQSSSSGSGERGRRWTRADLHER